MKSLSLEKMEKVEGGNGCQVVSDIFTGVAMVCAIGAMFTPASAIVLAAVFTSQGFAFGGVSALMHFGRACKN